jgi:hypothetical protein
MYDTTKTRMLLTTAVFAAVAALFAGGANAMFVDDGGSASGAPLFSSGHQLDTAIGTAMATRAAETAPLFSSGHQLDTAIGTAMATRAAETTPKPGDPGTIPYLSHGIGVDESLFSGQASPTAEPWGGQVSPGLTGDSALTRVNQPVGATGQATSSGNDTDWTWVGFGAGMAALLAAALTGLYFSARHRGRVVLP